MRASVLAALCGLPFAACATTSQVVAEGRAGMQDATAGLYMACPQTRMTPGCTIVRQAWRSADRSYQTMVVAAHDGQDVTAVAEETRANLKLFWTAADSVAPGDPYEQPRTLPSWAPCENPYRVPRPLIDLESNDLKTPAEFERVVTP